MSQTKNGLKFLESAKLFTYKCMYALLKMNDNLQVTIVTRT